jgi:DNA-binding MarR family transcriptional regulator
VDGRLRDAIEEMTGRHRSCSERREPVLQRLHLARETPNDEITLGVLAAVEADGKISQRTLSRELGVALGLANAYLKRCVRKGYIKIQQVPHRRYGYYLTPQGFSEKARLTAEYLTSSLTFFRRARAQISELMAECERRGWRRIVLAGATDIAEIATLTAHDHTISLVAVLDPEIDRDSFCGLPVIARIEDAAGVDAVILTQTGDSATLAAALAARLGADRILTPRLIKLAHINETAKRTRAAGEAGAAEPGE